jgi:hypothetical protein
MLVAIFGAARLLNGLFHRFKNFVSFNVFLTRNGIGYMQQFHLSTLTLRICCVTPAKGNKKGGLFGPPLKITYRIALL